MRSFRHTLLVMIALTGIVVPKLSGLVLHLHPGIMTAVICTGTELVTIHIGSDGEPVEMTEADHVPCVIADPDATVTRTLASWTDAPRSYRRDFVEITQDIAANSERGLLPDLRGPPGAV